MGNWIVISRIRGVAVVVDNNFASYEEAYDFAEDSLNNMKQIGQIAEYDVARIDTTLMSNG